jgi:hypothetical protein
MADAIEVFTPQLPRVINLEAIVAAREPEVRACQRCSAFAGLPRASPPPPPPPPSFAAQAPVPLPQLRGLWAAMEESGALSAPRLLPRHLRR